MQGVSMTLAEVAAAIGRSENTIRSWIRHGMPSEQVGRNRRINLGDLVTFRERQAAAIAAPADDSSSVLRRRRLAADTDRAETRVATERIAARKAAGELLPAEVVDAVFTDFILQIRGRGLALPQFAADFVGIESQRV